MPADRKADRHRTGIISTRLTDPAEDKRFRSLVARIPDMSISKAVTAAIRDWVAKHENSEDPG